MFEKYTVNELKHLIKQNNLQSHLVGYSKMKKEELVMKMNNCLTIENNQIIVKLPLVIIPVESNEPSISNTISLYQNSIKDLISRRQHYKKFNQIHQFENELVFLKQNPLKDLFNSFNLNGKYSKDSIEANLIVAFRKERDERYKCTSWIESEYKTFQDKDAPLPNLLDAINDSYILKSVNILINEKEHKESITALNELFSSIHIEEKEKLRQHVNTKHRSSYIAFKIAFIYVWLNSIDCGSNVEQAIISVENYFRERNLDGRDPCFPIMERKRTVERIPLPSISEEGFFENLDKSVYDEISRIWYCKNDNDMKLLISI